MTARLLSRVVLCQAAEQKKEEDELRADRLQRVAVYYECYVEPPPGASRVSTSFVYRCMCNHSA